MVYEEYSGRSALSIAVHLSVPPSTPLGIGEKCARTIFHSASALPSTRVVRPFTTREFPASLRSRSQPIVGVTTRHVSVMADRKL